MFIKELTQAGHTRRFSLRQAAQGWEILVEQDSDVVQRFRYTDWHRVERALSVISDEVSDLLESGWHERATVTP